MALQQKWTIEGGIEVPEAYHRIRSASLVNPLNEWPHMHIEVEIYKDKKTREEFKKPFSVVPYTINYPKNDPFNDVLGHAYSGLKNLVQYKGASDV